MKICHFTSAHPSNDVRIFEKECVSLAKAGFEVFLVAAGECDKEEKGVHIVTVKPKKQGRLYRMRRFAKLIFLKAFEQNADIYHFHDPELLRFAKKLKQAGKIVIYDAHEDLPLQISGKHWIPAFLRNSVARAAKKYLKQCGKYLSAIITATPAIEDSFIGFTKTKITVANYPIIDEVQIIENKSIKKNTFCYIGGVSEIRGLSSMLEVATKINITIEMAGPFSPPELINEAQQHPAWSKIVYHGVVGRQAVYEIMSRAKAGLVLLYPQSNYLESLPVKMFEYMAAGIPVIASNFPLWEKIISENECGICVDPKNPDAIAEAINYIINNNEKSQQMGANGQKAIQEKYNWKIEEKKLITLYKNLIDNA
ncbi:MAG: glycosyltransferase family 4 protein [Bacteroidales bacterium]|nr:glycosyltransferase family 4 protein [Bacteroidales bacterium]